LSEERSQSPRRSFASLSDAVRRVPHGLRDMAVAAFFFSVMSVLVKLATVRLPSS
jgi:hypothetical protein